MITVADILQGSLDKFLISHKLSYKQKKVVNKIINCFSENSRTLLFKCSNKECDYTEEKKQPCRDRHCNKCYMSKKLKWLLNLLKSIVCLPFYHVVFTLPSEVHNLAICNPKIIYDIFFKSSFYVLNKFSEDPKYLGAKIGYICLLHTWGERLNYHPHLHFMVLSGGIKNGKYKKLPYQGFMFPVTAMSTVMMGKFIEMLKEQYYEGKLKFRGEILKISSEQNFNNFLYKLSQKSWVINSKSPLPNSSRTAEYISRYTHKVAISNSRINSYGNGVVSFQIKNYKNTDKRGIPSKENIELEDTEFIRRFLLHILPHGFRKIRYGGIFSSNQKREAIRIIKESILDQLDEVTISIENVIAELNEKIRCICPKCNDKVLVNEYG